MIKMLPKWVGVPKPALAALISLAILAVFPQAGVASTASLTGGVLTITAGPGETNAVVVEVVNASPLNVSDAAGVTPGLGCEFRSATRVYCQTTTPSIVVSLGDGDDTFTNSEASSYTTTVTADGGPGNDTILAAGTSNHVLRGGDGNDTLSGASGDDQVLGEGGNDTVRGYGGADVVSGGPGIDLIEGDGSPFYLQGGSDRIDSRDAERDTVSCGFGTDSVTADAIDVIDAAECEAIDVPSGGVVPAPQPGQAPVIAMAAASKGKLSKLLSKSGAAFAFNVSVPCAARFTLTVARAEARRTKLGRRAVTLASGKGQIAAPGDFMVTVTPRGKYRRTLKGVKRLRTTLSLSCSSGGQTGRDTQRVTFTN